MTAIVLDHRSRHIPSRTSAGVSEVAAQLAESMRQVFGEYLRTARGQGLFASPSEELSTSIAEARNLAAIGEGNSPSAAALKEAHELLDSLPEAFARPVPTVEPSGAIGFEWDMGADKFLILALKGTGVLEFSVGTAPGERSWGVKNFAGRLDSQTLRVLAELGGRG